MQAYGAIVACRDEELLLRVEIYCADGGRRCALRVDTLCAPRHRTSLRCERHVADAHGAWHFLSVPHIPKANLEAATVGAQEARVAGPVDVVDLRVVPILIRGGRGGREAIDEVKW